MSAPARPRAKAGQPDATSVWEAAAVLEQIIGPGYELVHTKRMGWLLRRLESWPTPDGRSKSVYVEHDQAPDGQLGALLLRHQEPKRGEQ